MVIGAVYGAFRFTDCDAPGDTDQGRDYPSTVEQYKTITVISDGVNWQLVHPCTTVS